MIETVLSKLEQRLGGRLYAQQRLGIEADHEAQVFGRGLTFFHIENWYSIHSVIRTLFKLTGLDPLGALRLLNPMTWPFRVRLLKDARSFRSLSVRTRVKEIWERRRIPLGGHIRRSLDGI
jgi:hypothetical protein